MNAAPCSAHAALGQRLVAPTCGQNFRSSTRDFDHTQPRPETISVANLAIPVRSNPQLDARSFKPARDAVSKVHRQALQVELPGRLGTYCCSHFAVRRDRIEAHGPDFYRHLGRMVAEVSYGSDRGGAPVFAVAVAAQARALHGALPGQPTFCEADARDFLVLCLSDEEGGFVVIFSPIPQLVMMEAGHPDLVPWANPLTGESSETAGIEESRLDFGKGVGNFLVLKAALREQLLAKGEDTHPFL
eukprot:s875_g8.t1